MNHRARLPAAASLNSEAGPDDPGDEQSRDEDKFPEGEQGNADIKRPDDAFDALDDVILGKHFSVTV